MYLMTVCMLTHSLLIAIRSGGIGDTVHMDTQVGIMALAGTLVGAGMQAGAGIVLTILGAVIPDIGVAATGEAATGDITITGTTDHLGDGAEVEDLIMDVQYKTRIIARAMQIQIAIDVALIVLVLIIIVHVLIIMTHVRLIKVHQAVVLQEPMVVEW